MRIARTAGQARDLLSAGGIELVVSELDLGEDSEAADGGGDGISLLVEARRAPWGA